MGEELKGCPFCGKNGETELVEQTDNDGISYSIACTTCRFQIGTVVGNCRDRWNKRPAEDKLRARIAELEAALEFYANPDTYFAIGFFPDLPCGDFMDDFEEIDIRGYKPGKKARECLDRKNTPDV